MDGDGKVGILLVVGGGSVLSGKDMNGKCRRNCRTG